MFSVSDILSLNSCCCCLGKSSFIRLLINCFLSYTNTVLIRMQYSMRKLFINNNVYTVSWIHTFDVFNGQNVSFSFIN